MHSFAMQSAAGLGLHGIRRAFARLDVGQRDALARLLTRPVPTPITFLCGACPPATRRPARTRELLTSPVHKLNPSQGPHEKLSRCVISKNECNGNGNK